MGINIAIDGPSGAGKSTLSRKLAAEVGFIYVDTGAMYRTIGLFVLRNKIDPKDTERVVEALNGIKVTLSFIEGEQHVFLNGEDVSSDIRLHEVSQYASLVSAIPAVRQFLFEMQQKLAAENDVIMDGRDIGTVVLPNADLKIFLTASAEDRANRRYQELIQRGQDVDYDQILQDVVRRDEQDMNRSVAPLKPAEDSVILDTSGFEFEQSLALLLKTVKERLNIAL
ncbi:MAG: (d)CMP kinase, partial [Clostridia bacterium]|nr:(d)CMP kinase [Clostridia bacterium]